MDQIGPDSVAAQLDNSAFEPFAARAPWLNGHLQTIRNAISKRPGIAAASHRRLVVPIEMATRQHPGDALALVLDAPPRPVAGRPLMVLVHGLGGCEDSAYMRVASAFFLQAGAHVLRVNLRGAGPSQISAQDWSHAGRYLDLKALLERLVLPAEASGIVVVGYSLGGNMLLNYLGRTAPEKRLRAAISVSAPLDMPGASKAIHAPRNWVYHAYLLKHLKRQYLNPFSSLTAAERKAVERAPTLFAVDDAFTAPHHGFKNADDYYHKVSAAHYLGGIELPTLLIHARDDPFVPAEPYGSVPPGPCRLLVVDGGGHLGFHDRGGVWYLRQIRTFLGSHGFFR